ncbi:MAG: hypothetical protein BWY81_01294 [Firmicutes bacterium ADurb.Bin467]|nr:MAG: hypothetical protein BWY81_01294 [Firmicutes bacterium ADurb.Bin467]
MSTTLWRMRRSLTLPTSNWNASSMCCFSGSERLFQNSAAWPKKSLNVSLRARTTAPSTFSSMCTYPSAVEAGMGEFICRKFGE